MNSHRLPPLKSAYVYMFLFSLRFTDVYWVVYLRGKGLSFAAVGLLETVFHIASFSSEVPTGLIADRFGRRVSIFCGRVLAAISAALTLYARNWSLLATSFAVSAISYTCHSGAFDALVYDSLPEQRKEDFTALIGRLNSAYLVGTALTGAIASMLARFSLELLYVVAIATDIAAAVVALSLPEDASRRRPRLEACKDSNGFDGGASSLISDLRSLLKALKRPELRNFLLLWGIEGALGTSVVFYGQSVMKDALLPIGLIGLCATAGNLLAILPASSIYRVQKRFGQKIPVIVGSFTLLLIVLCLGLMSGTAGAFPKAAIVALYVSIAVLQETLYPLFSDAVNARAGSLNRAAVLSSGSMVFSIGMMAIFPLIGYFGDRLGLRWGLIAAACLTAAAVAPLAHALAPVRHPDQTT